MGYYKWMIEEIINEFDFKPDEIADSIDECRSEINSRETAIRRTSTVIAWIKWIIELSTIIEHNPYE